MTTPIQSALDAYLAKDMSRLHMPGHKGRPLPPFGDLLAYDVTEVEGTDSLFHCDGAIRDCERAFSAAYGSGDTLISCGGSTLCIQAMLFLAALSGKKKIIAARNLHLSAVNAMALLGLEPVWVYPQNSGDGWIAGAISPREVQALLEEEPDVCGVYVTSPTYFGVLSDIPALAEIAHSHGVPLLVDNAHGAHLPLLASNLHPMALVADFCCDSLHKSLPVLTGGALLHLRDPALYQRAKQAMGTFGSTSPSYLILLSIDRCLEEFTPQGRAKYQEAAQQVSQLEALARQKGFGTLEGRRDSMKLSLFLGGTNLTGEALGALLREHGIEPEYLSDGGGVLMVSPYNTPRDLERIRTFLQDCPPLLATGVQPQPLPRLPKGMGLREALLSPQEEILVDQALGRIAAGVTTTCPPGAPLVMSGEIVTESSIQFMKNSGISHLHVVK